MKTATPEETPKLSRHQPPEDLSTEDWQRALRRQFGREQAFVLENVGDAPIFSEFRVRNPEAKTAYRVAIRGTAPGDNACTCPDFATNELGTCKHIEFTLAALERKRGAKSAFRRGFTPPYSELRLRYGNRRAVHFKPGTECPEALLEAARQLFDAAAGWLLAPERFGELEAFFAAARQAGHELRAEDAALDFIAGVRDAARRRLLLDRAFPRGAASPALAKLLKVPLYPYQAEGALFAARTGRCLIGDEMGLGKTIQAIGAAEILAKLCGLTRVLVVCPTSLKQQWRREIERFSGREARVIGGLRTARQKSWAAEDFCKITNYERLQPDLDLIGDWSPELVIVDEAQRVKNWNTIAARALKRIDSPYAIVLTGTPLENKLEELISIVQFVDQHRLGPTWKLMHRHTVRDERGRTTGYRELEKIGATLAPVMIRRRKKDVLLQLPERTDQNLFVPMTEPQMVHHRDNAETVKRIVQRWRKTGFLSDADQRRLTCALQNMRMSCNSTYLLDRETDHGVKADELAALLDELFVDGQAKAVVFSQWQRTHEIVARRLDARGIGHVMFNGSVPSEQRQALVDRFRDDPGCRVFLSTDAGSTGLNLQHASTLINMDLPWNPAVLEQRIARIHRMGQQRQVRIVNFVAQGTIEEGMLEVLAFKRSLAAGILDGGQGEISLDGTRLSRFMKEVEKVTGAIGDAETMAPAEEIQAAAGAEAAVPEVADVTEAMADSATDAVPLRVRADADSGPAGAAPGSTPGVGDPWAALLGVGAQFAEALKAAAEPAVPGQTSAHSWIERDERTGRASLRVPLPEPETARQLVDVFAGLAGQLAEVLRRR